MEEEKVKWVWNLNHPFGGTAIKGCYNATFGPNSAEYSMLLLPPPHAQTKL